jgi:hypothetical protein
LKKRQVANDPIFSLVISELGPLIGVKESIAIREMKKLAEESTDLCLSTKWVVSDGDGLIVGLQVHYSNAPGSV